MGLVQTLVRGIWTELIGYFGSRELQHFILSRRTPGVVLCPCDWLFLWGDVFMVLSVTRAKFGCSHEAASSSGLCAMAAVPLRPGSLKTKHEFS